MRRPDNTPQEPPSPKVWSTFTTSGFFTTDALTLSSLSPQRPINNLQIPKMSTVANPEAIHSQVRLVEMNGNPCAGPVRPQRAERKIKPPLIFEIDKPNTVPTTSQRQIDTATGSQYKVTAVRVTIGKMKAPIADKNLPIRRHPPSFIWNFCPNEISRLMGTNLFVDSKKPDLSLVADPL